MSPTALSPVCVLAGGLGSRLGDRVRATPKPLLPVAGKPFVHHQLELLTRHGADRVVLCVGYLGERIADVVGDGAALGLDVSYVFDGPTLAGTAGAVRRALPQLGDRFLVLYGDTYLRIDYRAVEEALEASGLPALMCVLHNRGAWERSNATFRDGRVTRHAKAEPTPDMEWIDYGLGAFHAEALELGAPTATDLADVYADLAARGLLAGFEATERFYEIGTPESLRETDAFLRTGKASVGPRRASSGFEPA